MCTSKPKPPAATPLPPPIQSVQVDQQVVDERDRERRRQQARRGAASTVLAGNQTPAVGAATSMAKTLLGG